MRNEQEIRALLARYDEGLATAEEELRLRDLLADVEALPADLQAAATLFEGFAAWIFCAITYREHKRLEMQGVFWVSCQSPSM